MVSEAVYVNEIQVKPSYLWIFKSIDLIQARSSGLLLSQSWPNLYPLNVTTAELWLYFEGASS